MKPVLAALRSLLVLAACLAVLALAAWIVGELPPRDAIAERTEAARAREAEARAARERTEHERAERARAAAAAQEVDAGVDAATPPPPGHLRHRACDEAVTASLTRTRLDARGRDLLGIGCGDALDVVGFVDASPVLVAHLVPSDVDQSAPVRRFTLLAEDVTGDGMIDWLVGTTRGVDGASPAVGTLHLVPGDGRGGLAEARLLAPLAVAGMDVGRIDADETLDVAVLHRPDPLGSRAPEVWVFRGGASFVRASRATVASDVVDLALLDADLDGSADLVPVRGTQPTFALLAGDGAGTFGRSIELTASPATRAHRVLVPGLGPRLLLVGRTPTFVVPASPAPSATSADLGGAPRTSDVRTDPEREAMRVAVIVDGEVRDLVVDASGVRRLSTRVVPAADGMVLDAVLGDFTASAGLELALLVERPGSPVERDLVLVDDLAESSGAAQTISLAEERPAIARAPLHLTIPLR